MSFSQPCPTAPTSTVLLPQFSKSRFQTDPLYCCNCDLALELSQTRYKLGLASIVELSQAQLQQTQAQIGGAQATYQYRLALAVLNFQIANF